MGRGRGGAGRDFPKRGGDEILSPNPSRVWDGNGEWYF